MEMVSAFEKLGHTVKISSVIGEKTNIKMGKVKLLEKIRKAMPDPIYEILQAFTSILEYKRVNKLIKNFKPDLIYKRHAKSDWGPVLAANKHGIPIILEVNCVYSGESLSEFEPLYFPSLGRKVERWICLHVDKNITVSTPLKDELISLGVPSHQIVVMPNGANFEKFHPGIDGSEIKEKYKLNGKLVLGFTGTLWRWHGLDFLLHTLSKIDIRSEKLHLLVVGDGRYRSKLEELTGRLGLERFVTFTGKVPHDEIPKYIAAMDITILPAERRRHASPMKILEYMAMGKPVIAPRMTNIEEIIEDGKDGILFDPDNGEDLKRAILVLTKDKELRIKLGQEARRKIVNKLNWINNARKVLEIYNELKRKGHSDSSR